MGGVKSAKISCSGSVLKFLCIVCYYIYILNINKVSLILHFVSMLTDTNKFIFSNKTLKIWFFWTKTVENSR